MSDKLYHLEWKKKQLALYNSKNEQIGVVQLLDNTRVNLEILVEYENDVEAIQAAIQEYLYPPLRLLGVRQKGDLSPFNPEEDS